MRFRSALATLLVGLSHIACDGGSSGGGESSGEGSTTEPGSTTSVEVSTTGAQTSSTTEEGTSSSGGGSTATGDPSDSETDTETGGASSECALLGGTLLAEYEVHFEIHRVLEADVATEPLGPLCLLPDEDSWVLALQWGAMEGGQWESQLRVRVPDAGTYDLSSDFGVPGSGTVAPASLSYARTQGAETVSFDTANQGAKGTVQVDDWPAVAGEPVTIRADGNIAGEEGWQFQFTLESKSAKDGEKALR